MATTKPQEGKVRPTWNEVYYWAEGFDGEREIAAQAKRRWAQGAYDITKAELAARRERGY